jgi:selenocysteine lyase/cysteine desulfurase
MNANREIYKTREAVARLTGAQDPLSVAFTSSATESLNLVIHGLIRKGDRVITTLAEHNSVLRPLYNAECLLDFMECDDNGRLDVSALPELIGPDVKYLICTHASNVTGNLTDVASIYEICKEKNVIMILDVSQTLGLIETNAAMADILCFTGHKALLGPQGTGGIVINKELRFSPVKTGGAGVNSFDRVQSAEIPDIFEAGTMNSHGLFGLQKGVEFILEKGVDAIHAKEKTLMDLFYNSVKDISNVVLYGDFSTSERIPVISLNIVGIPSSELSGKLWEDYRIATRSGVHCAPLLHKRFNTEEQGMCRFSFSYFNTRDEIEAAAGAVRDIARHK